MLWEVRAAVVTVTQEGPSRTEAIMGRQGVGLISRMPVWHRSWHRHPESAGRHWTRSGRKGGAVSDTVGGSTTAPLAETAATGRTRSSFGRASKDRCRGVEKAETCMLGSLSPPAERWTRQTTLAGWFWAGGGDCGRGHLACRVVGGEVPRDSITLRLPCLCPRWNQVITNVAVAEYTIGPLGVRPLIGSS